MKTLRFQWGVSRGRDTYGYNVCTLYVDDKRVASTSGGGYDMRGAVLGEWMQKEFADQLKGFRANYGSGDDETGLYGLWFNYRGTQVKEYLDGATFGLDGACGQSSMERILGKLGYQLKNIHYGKNQQIYILETIGK